MAWSLDAIKREIKEIEQLTIRLNSIGFEVCEINDVSDEAYSFIGAKYKDERGKSGSPWAFSGQDWSEFYGKAELFLKGYNHKKENNGTNRRRSRINRRSSTTNKR